MAQNNFYESISIIRSGVLLKKWKIIWKINIDMFHSKLYLRSGYECLDLMLQGICPLCLFFLSLHISPVWEHFHATVWLMLPLSHFCIHSCVVEHGAVTWYAGTCHYLCQQELWNGWGIAGDRDAGLPVLWLACILAADPPSPRNRWAPSQFGTLKQCQT